VPGGFDYRAEALRPTRGHTTPKDSGPVPDRTESARSAHPRPENGSRPAT